MNIEKLKEKVDNLKRREQELAVREQVVNSFIPIKKTLASKIKDDVAHNSIALVQEMASSIKSTIEETSDVSSVVEQLQLIKESLSSDKNKQVVESLNDIFTSVQELSKKTYFDQQKFDEIFTEKINTIVNILLSNDEIPTNVSYKRNTLGKVTKVIETYNDFTLEHSWTYDRNNRLVNVKTIKK